MDDPLTKREWQSIPFHGSRGTECTRAHNCSASCSVKRHVLDDKEGNEERDARSQQCMKIYVAVLVLRAL